MTLISVYIQAYKSPIPEVNSLYLMLKMGPFKGGSNFKAVDASSYVIRSYKRCDYRN